MLGDARRAFVHQPAALHHVDGGVYVQVGTAGGPDTLLLPVYNNRLVPAEGGHLISDQPAQGMVSEPGASGIAYRCGPDVAVKEMLCTPNNLQELAMSQAVHAAAAVNPLVAQGVRHLGLIIRAGITQEPAHCIAHSQGMYDRLSGHFLSSDTRVYAVMRALDKEVRCLGTAEWTAEATFKLCDHLLAGVASLHAAGIAHCDLKPDNFMRGYDGNGYVIDLGLAQDLAETHGLVHPIDCTRFSAPESALGCHAWVDGKAYDAYTVGLMVEAMLAWCLRARGYSTVVSVQQVVARMQRHLGHARVHTHMRAFEVVHPGASAEDWADTQLAARRSRDGSTRQHLLPRAVSRNDLLAAFNGNEEDVHKFQLLLAQAHAMMAINPAMRAMPSQACPPPPSDGAEQMLNYVALESDALLGPALSSATEYAAYLRHF